MSNKKPDKKLEKKTVNRIKTGSIERRFSMAKAGFLASSRFARKSASSYMFDRLHLDKDQRAKKQSELLSEQAQWLVGELGQLKGSIVKVGQMMALLGEHFLPQELTDALHTLENDTMALHWSSLEPHLKKQLGDERYAELEVDPEPLAAASLGQVHKALHKETGRMLCLKIQYPGVAEAIDSDLNMLVQLLRVTRMVPMTKEFQGWVDEVRSMMHRELDYRLEFETTQYFYNELADDPRYIVPEVFADYSNGMILASSFEKGVKVDNKSILSLPQNRRNDIGKAIMDLFCREVFEWKKMQTDPNFGNYLIHADEEQDKIILLDFGAFRDFEDEIILPARKMIYHAYHHNVDGLIEAIHSINFLNKDVPPPIMERFAELCFIGVEVLQDPDKFPPPAEVLNENKEYLWGESNLPKRILTEASKNAFSKYFDVPPKEFIFLSRKLLGAYTFLHVIEAEVRGNYILDPFLEGMEKNGEV
jgi:predicted unusual protein kinase regulating ubiquinone biosynthesis (AarF/ABC1/UbiB family)